MSSALAVESPPFPSLSFEEKLDRFARVAVHVGLNLQPGQELLISATTEMLPLVRRITEHAYKVGALLVTAFYADDEAALARYRYASDDSFDYAPQWLAEGVAAAFRGGAARLALTGADPALLAGQDSAKVSRANIAAFEGQQTSDGVDHAPRHQLDDRGCGNPGVGTAGLSRVAGGRGRPEALGRDLPGVARYFRRSPSRVGSSIARTCTTAWPSSTGSGFMRSAFMPRTEPPI